MASKLPGRHHAYDEARSSVHGSLERLGLDHVDVVHVAIDDRLAEAEGRLDHAIAYSALVRFDAYNEMSGRQSTSIALLDSARNGVVLSSIHHRDTSRLYAKQVSEGKGELKLSPEEEEALRIALAS